MKNGFTLIELLVVVLIIGILAAVAVPNYQKAVVKSKVVQAVIMLKAITDAQERYFLVNSKYTDDILDLDIVVPDELIGEFSVVKKDVYTFGCLSGRCDAVINKANIPRLEFVMKNAVNAYQGQHWCISKNEVTRQICISMGGYYDGTSYAANYYIIN